MIIIKKLFKAVFILATFSVITRFISFLYKIYLSRIISTETLGLYTIVLSVFMVFVTLLSSGLPLTISRITASNKVSKNYNHTYSIVYCGFKIELLISVILIAILLIFKNVFMLFLGSNYSYYMLLTLIPAIICAAIYSPFKGYLWGEEQYFKVSIVEFVEQIIKILALFVLTIIGMNMESLLPLGYAISISAILSTILGIVFYIKNGGRFSNKQKCYKSIICSTLPLTTTRLCGSLMSPLISIILPIRLISMGYTKSQSLSMLGIAMGMAFPILTIPSTLIGSLSMALIPEIATIIQSGNSCALKKQINSSLLFTMCCSFICLPPLISLAEPMCQFLFDNIEAGIYLKYASWTIIPTGLSGITTSILNSIGKERQTFIYFLISSIITILVILVSTPIFGIHSLFIALGLGMTVTFVLNATCIKKSLHLSLPIIKNISILTLITIPTTLLSSWLYNLLIFLYGNFVSMIICGIICAMTFTLLLVVFNLLDISIITKKFQSHKKLKTC